MNKKNKKIMAILVASIIFISYITYSEILSYDRSARVEPKMLTEKQMLDIFGIHNYTICWYRNSSNFSVTSEYAFACTGLDSLANLTTNPQTRCLFSFSDALYIYKNQTNPFSNYKDHRYMIWYSPIYYTHYEVNGSVNFTFYVPEILNSSYNPNKCGNITLDLELPLAALNFTLSDGYKLIILSVPFILTKSIQENFALYAGVAQNIFLSVKGVSYESVKQQEGLFI
ncbi:MAG: hypothetical protein M1375_04025 [Candidatus Thermoplasmatota archaeon]|jgi:hypothetical protein|nr:hypothetical protein [Candidatus Thermoplasmatota archaeon]MCL5791122.1 hypothetical protein [Candidatus Thermoplasmatota archaeon]